MRFRKFFCALFAALFVSSSLAPLARADEGMWTFNNVPRAEIERRYGFKITDEWLRHAQLASVRFNNGGSGSFVSPDGLALTNYHIVEDFVGELSTPQKDYAREGFLARTRAEELRIPGTELNVLMTIEDVTDRVNAAITPQMSAADAFAARRTAIAAIEKDSTDKTGLRSDVVTLFQGGRYNLYRYKKYTDVRLVFCPEFQAAFFGGDPDNFEFPRFNIDMALVRVYENNEPIHPQSYLKWSTKGVKENELVFVTGHPGSTSRLNTVANLEELRDVSIPLVIRQLERREAVLKKYMALGPEQTRRAQNELNSVQNSLKVYRGQLKGLQSAKLISDKRAAETKLVSAVKADPQRQKLYGDAWDAIAADRRALATFERDRRFLDLGAGFSTVYFPLARTIVRLAYESEKPDAERLPEFGEVRRHSIENTLYAEAPVYDDFEKLKLADSLDFMREVYGADNELVKRVLAGKSPEARAAELIDGTKLKSVDYRKQLVAGGRKAIDASDDPMIKLALSIDADARRVRSRYENEVVGVERNAYAKIAQALFATEGDKVYPDATFTLRLSYGAVKGYKEDDGKTVAPFTTLGGLYDRAAQFNSKFPYNLPPRWTERKGAVDLKTPFNFVSSNDIIGGNSGSPVINKDGELVGLIFDGNRQSIVGNFYYDESINRAISVDVRAMLEVLRHVFNADNVAAELTGQAAKGVTASR
ncbi:MAG: S46 family peptidase [Pyrinomonadaceae bacterium]